MKTYFTIWRMMTINTLQISIASRFGAVLFLIGKLLRFSLFLYFLFILVSKTNTLSGYTLWQVVFFYATFNLVDTLAQLFFREVYRFRTYITSGFFDYILVKPSSVIFRSLFGGTDLLDLPILLLSILFLVYSGWQMGSVGIISVFVFIAFLANAFLIAVSFHILVISVGVLTTEVDNMLWIYRDFTQLARVPIDIYKSPLREFITFIIPVGVMITFPAKAFMGLLSAPFVVFTFVIGIVLFLVSKSIWSYSIRRYTSASS